MWCNARIKVPLKKILAFREETLSEHIAETRRRGALVHQNSAMRMAPGQIGEPPKGRTFRFRHPVPARRTKAVMI